MPLPKALARFNRAVTNRLTAPVAGWLPAFAIVTHVGRRSGRTYNTPVNIFVRGNRCTFALTYGSDVQWVRNVQAAGECRVRTRGRLLHLVEPRLYVDRSRRAAPAVVRLMLGLLSVTEFLEMRIAPTTS